MEKERYPSFICIDNNKLPEFTNEIVSGLELKRSKTVMHYQQQLEQLKDNELKVKDENSNSFEPLLNIGTISSAFIPVDNSKSPGNCNLN